MLCTMQPACSDVPDDANPLLLTLPAFNLSELEHAKIDKPMTIRSSVRTMIICPSIEITSPGVVLDGLDFHGSVHLNAAHRTKILNCTFHDAAPDKLAFLSVTASREVRLEDVTIAGAGTCPGLYLRQNARVTAARVTVRNLSESLIVINTGAHFTVSDSFFSDSSANLVYSSGGSQLDMRRCTLSRGAFPGIFMREGMTVLRENRFEQMKQNGISLNKVRNFVVEENQLEDIQSSAIAVGEESKGVVRGNHLRNIHGNGIYISGSSEVLLEGNTIDEGKFPGIALLLGTSAVLRQNVIRTVECNGMCLRGAKRVEISGLTVVGSTECGISISDTAFCKIDNSVFGDCRVAGIECYNRSKIEVLGCAINNCQIAFQVYTGAKLRATGNSATNVSQLARVSFGGRARVTGTVCTRVQALADAQTTQPCVFSLNGAFEDWTSSPKIANRLGIPLVPALEESGARLCLKCNALPRAAFLMDCGHRVYCEQCAKNAKEAKELCPLCRFPIANTTLGYEVNGDELCMICLENQPTCIAIPCGHCGFCKSCMEYWYKENRTCPACRNEPSSFKEIVLDL
jgi:parallel beta-helix repeat protein